jgi:hypothetical protein
LRSHPVLALLPSGLVLPRTGIAAENPAQAVLNLNNSSNLSGLLLDFVNVWSAGKLVLDG